MLYTLGVGWTMTEDDGVEDAEEADDVESITASHIPGGFML